MPPQPAQEREPSRRRPWHQGPGDADCRWNLFSMYCRTVGQVIFANWLATTSAMSGKSPIHSSRRLVPGSLSVVSEARVSKLHTRARSVCALSIQRLEGRRWRLRRMRANGYGNSIFSPICKLLVLRYLENELAREPQFDALRWSMTCGA
jgi:hypothetical protein